MSWKRFAGVPGSVGLARAWTRRELRGMGVEEQAVTEATYVVSELASNAIRHSRSGDVGGSFIVDLTVRPTQVTIVVTDQGTTANTLPAWNIKPDPLAEHGRGLLLIASLVEDYTTIAEADRCTVRTQLPLLVPATGERR